MSVRVRPKHRKHQVVVLCGPNHRWVVTRITAVANRKDWKMRGTPEYSVAGATRIVPETDIIAGRRVKLAVSRRPRQPQTPVPAVTSPPAPQLSAYPTPRYRLYGWGWAGASPPPLTKRRSG